MRLAHILMAGAAVSLIASAAYSQGKISPQGLAFDPTGATGAAQAGLQNVPNSVFAAKAAAAGISGAVSSVNGAVGAVTVTPSSIGAVPTAGGTVSGSLKLTGSTLTPTNLYSSPPANGDYLAPAGAQWSYYPIVGGDNWDVTRAAHYIPFTTQAGAGQFESGLVVNSHITTGAAASWTASTSYAAGAQILGPVNLNVYQAQGACTSAASGGPVGTTNMTYGQTIADGTCTWVFLQNNAYYGKAGVSIFSRFSPGASGAVWGMYENNIIDPGSNLIDWYGHEIDASNNDTDCNVYQKTCATLYVGGGIGANPLGYVLQVSPQANGSKFAYHYGINFNGSTAIDTVTYQDNTNAPIAFGCGIINPSSTHSAACVQDRTTSPAAYSAIGKYSLSPFNDGSTGSYDSYAATGTKTHATLDLQDTSPLVMSVQGNHAAGISFANDQSGGTMLIMKAGQTACWNGLADCIYYSSAAGKWYFTNASQAAVASLSDSGNLIVKGTVTQNGTP